MMDKVTEKLALMYLAERKKEGKSVGKAVKDWPEEKTSTVEFSLSVCVKFPLGTVAVVGEVEL